MPVHISDVGLPEGVRVFFWEYDASRLVPERDGAIIMLRLMERGDQPALRWLRATYGDAALAEFLERRRGRGLSEKRIRYWALLLQLRTPLVDEWLADLRKNPWYTRVAR